MRRNHILLAILTINGSSCTIMHAGYAARRAAEEAPKFRPSVLLMETDIVEAKNNGLEKLLQGLKQDTWKTNFDSSVHGIFNDQGNLERIKIYIKLYLTYDYKTYSQRSETEFQQEKARDPLNVAVAECDVDLTIAAILSTLKSKDKLPNYSSLCFYDEYGCGYLINVRYKQGHFIGYENSFGDKVTFYNDYPLLNITDLNTISDSTAPTAEQKTQVSAAMPGYALTDPQIAKIFELCNASTRQTPSYAEITNAGKKALFYLGKKPDGSLLIEDRSKRYVDILPLLPYKKSGSGLTGGDGFNVSKDAQGNLSITCYKYNDSRARRLLKTITKKETATEQITIPVTPAIALRLCDLYYKYVMRNSRRESGVRLVATSNQGKQYNIEFLFTNTDEGLKIKPITDSDLIPQK